MIYTGIGDDLAKIDYREDPLAKTIAPNYQKLSMSAWGMPELNDLQQFNPEMEKNIDTVPDQFNQYVQGLNDLKSKVQGLMKTGVDITKPSLDPQVNAAHLEFLQKFNNITALGKQLQQSRKLKDQYATLSGKNGVWTNPIDESKMITSLNDYSYAPDFDAFEKGILAKAKKREELFKSGQVELANAENDAIKTQLDTYINQVPPAFKEQAKVRAENLKALIPDAIQDVYKNDKLALQEKIHNDRMKFNYATLNSKSDQLQSDFPLIVSDLINGNSNNYGSLLKGVVVGKTFVNTGTDEEPKNVEVDNIIKDVKYTTGNEAKKMFGQKFNNDDGQTTTFNDDDKVVVLYRTSGAKVIRIKKADGTYDMTGIQTLNSLQSPYDKYQVTPTTDFSVNQNQVNVDPSKSYKQFSKKTTQNNQTTTTKKKISW